MIKRYELNVASGLMVEGWPDEMVAASDYDALAIKFANAAVKISKLEAQFRLIAGHCFDVLERPS